MVISPKPNHQFQQNHLSSSVMISLKIISTNQINHWSILKKPPNHWSITKSPDHRMKTLEANPLTATASPRHRQVTSLRCLCCRRGTWPGTPCEMRRVSGCHHGAFNHRLHLLVGWSLGNLVNQWLVITVSLNYPMIDVFSESCLILWLVIWLNWIDVGFTNKLVHWLINA